MLKTAVILTHIVITRFLTQAQAVNHQTNNTTHGKAVKRKSASGCVPWSTMFGYATPKDIHISSLFSFVNTLKCYATRWYYIMYIPQIFSILRQSRSMSAHHQRAQLQITGHQTTLYYAMLNDDLLYSVK